LFRALAEYQELHPVIEDDLFALRDSYLRALADRSELTVLERSGSIRDFAGEAQTERELARTILHETTLAWSTLRASPDRATAAAYQLEKLSGERVLRREMRRVHGGPRLGSRGRETAGGRGSPGARCGHGRASRRRCGPGRAAQADRGGTHSFAHCVRDGSVAQL
ncbi:MAG: hypothetical protein AAFX94_19375, partial [Myxococcota bacterium]